jgi:hypothetical protein
MTLRPGEVVLIRIDFHQAPGGELRRLGNLAEADRISMTEALRRAFSLEQ